MLQDAIHHLTQENPIPEAASRTDRHVHARGQVASFFLEKTWEESKLQRGLNAHLPNDIRVCLASEALPSFHPTLDASEKEYHYHLSLCPVHYPTHRLYAWHFPHPLSFNAMDEAARQLIGKKDFSAFANEQKDNPICTLSTIDFDRSNDQLIIKFKGDRFLYKMVRNLVGLLVYAGQGKIALSQIPLILESKDRKKAAITAPAHGLFLHKVIY